jgi:hypothetical protein
VVTRGDLAPAIQACQAIHAAIEFAVAHSRCVLDWHLATNVVVLLAAADELALGWLCDDAEAAGLLLVRFYEPNLDGCLTAAALEPGAHRLVSHLPLALSGDREEVRR